MLDFWSPSMVEGLVATVLVGWLASLCLVFVGRCGIRIWRCIRPSDPDLVSSPRRLLVRAGLYLVVSMVLYRLMVLLFFEWVFLAQ